MPTKLTKSVDGYRYEELSQNAKFNANTCVNTDHFWASEIYKSFEAVKVLVAKNIYDWQTESELCKCLSELKETDTYSVLTGYCADYDAIEAAIKCVETVNGEEVVFDEDRYERALYKCVEDDWDGQCSDESTRATCDANDYWFDISGKLLSGYETVTKG